MFIPHIRGKLGNFALKTGYFVDNFFIICVRQIAQRKFYPPNSAPLLSESVAERTDTDSRIAKIICVTRA